MVALNACRDYLNYDPNCKREVHHHLSGGEKELHHNAGGGLRLRERSILKQTTPMLG